MKRILAVAAAAAALAVAAPASADPSRYEQRGQGGYEQNYDRSGYNDRNDNRGDYRNGQRYGQQQRFSRNDIAQLQARIDWGARSGRLNRQELRRLNFQLADLRDRSRYYFRTDGVSWRERQDLEARYDRLRYEIRRQISDDDFRRSGWRG